MAADATMAAGAAAAAAAGSAAAAGVAAAEIRLRGGLPFGGTHALLMHTLLERLCSKSHRYTAVASATADAGGRKPDGRRSPAAARAAMQKEAAPAASRTAAAEVEDQQQQAAAAGGGAVGRVDHRAQWWRSRAVICPRGSPRTEPPRPGPNGTGAPPCPALIKLVVSTAER